MNNQSFDILDYLNNIYIQKMGGQVELLKAGGHYNREGDNSNEKEDKMLEINKKRINIPDASIKFFSFGQQGDITEDNETEDDTDRPSETKSYRKGYHETSTETEQERGSSSALTEEVITI